MMATVHQLQPRVVLTAGQAAGVALVEQAVAQGIPAVIIEGYAGTGKSTAMRQLAHLYPLQLAPTGKAALRLREVTGIPTSTIHRWLYQVWEDDRGKLHFSQRETDIIKGCRCIVVDEASMVDERVWNDLLEAGRHHKVPIVLVGDRAQLPPVAAGDWSVLKVDLPRVSLTQILRQAEANPIIAASKSIREGNWIAALKTFPRVAPGALVAEALEVYQRGGVVLCHRNRTRAALNRGIRAELGYPHRELQVGEPLLVLKNNYLAEAFNGEVVRFVGWVREPWADLFAGRQIHIGIAEVDVLEADGGNRRIEVWLCQEVVDGAIVDDLVRLLAKDFDARPAPGHQVPLPFLQAQYGYALTTHKSQGSQWPEVLVVLEPTVPMHKTEGRQWAYTAVTRAEERVRINFGVGGLEAHAAKELSRMQGELL